MVGKSETLVVIVEDDHHISDLVALYLRRDGFRVRQADDGESGLALILSERPRLVIVDIGLPGELDGFDLCRRIRSGGTAGPAAAGGGAARPGGQSGSPVAETAIVLLSARDDELDRVLGLELGADDYVTKPFSARELVARVHAILRRSNPAPGPVTGSVLTVGAVEVDLDRREVRSCGETVAFTAREFDLLAYLASHPGLALSRRQLLDAVWGDDWYGDERTVDVHVRQLRKKLADALPLATVWGVGYRLG